MKVCPSCSLASLGQLARCPQCDEALDAATDVGGDQLEGVLIDRKYQLDACIGEGAMGWVYRGTHQNLQSTVAVKIMKPVFEDDGSRVARFEQEARASSRLNHPHILMIYDFGRTAGGLLYIVSEFLEGVTLSQLLDSGEQVPLGRAVNIFNQVLAAVDEAHSQRLIHRDLKPENIMLTQLRSGEDFTKVLDFGIARMADQGGARLTQQGELCGTPAYMAPEQIRGKDADERSDLYSLGLIFYELLAGRSPFQSESVMEMLALQLHTAPAPLRQAAPDRELPEALELVLERCLTKEPEDRYGSVSELREAIFVGLKDVEGAKTPCHACQLHRPAWSTRCVSCGLGTGGAIAAAIDTAQEPAAPTPPPEASSGVVATASTLHLPSGTGALPAPATSSVITTSFVGRRGELEQIAAFLGGDRPLLEVVAPAGSGKTMLLDASARGAEQAGWRVLRAGADPHLSRVPWYPVRRLVRQALGIAEGRRELGELRQHAIQAGLVSEDVPGLADLFGLERATDAVRPSIRVRETQAAALRAILGPALDAAGLCLILDDVDEFDGASLAFLRRLGDHLPACHSKMVMAAERSVLAADGAQESLYLGPFDEAQVEALVTSSLPGQAIPETLVRSVLDTSGGHPLHASETLRLVAEGHSSVAGDIADLVRRRLEGLAEPSRRVLQAICLVGNRASLDLVREALGVEAGVDAAVETLVARGFVLRCTADEVEVSHPQVGELVREGLDVAERSGLQGRIYDALGRAGAGFLERARHAFEAQLGDESLALLQQAGELAEHWLDDEGAAVHFRQALHVARWELLLGEDDERFLVLSLKLGNALTSSGHFLAAEMVFKEAIASSTQRPDIRVRLHGGLARLLSRRGLLEEALVVRRQVVSQALTLGAPALLLEGYLELAALLEQTGELDEAVSELDEGLLLLSAGEGAGPSGLWRLLLRSAELRHQQGEVESPLSLVAQGLEQARKEQSLDGQGRCHLALARWLGPEEGLDEAEAALSTAVAAFRRLGDRRSVAECLLVHARFQPSNRESLAEEARELAAQVQWGEGLAEATRLLSDAA